MYSIMLLCISTIIFIIPRYRECSRAICNFLFRVQFPGKAVSFRATVIVQWNRLPLLLFSFEGHPTLLLSVPAASNRHKIDHRCPFWHAENYGNRFRFLSAQSAPLAVFTTAAKSRKSEPGLISQRGLCHVRVIFSFKRTRLVKRWTQNCRSSFDCFAFANFSVPLTLFSRNSHFGTRDIVMYSMFIAIYKWKNIWTQCSIECIKYFIIRWQLSQTRSPSTSM